MYEKQFIVNVDSYNIGNSIVTWIEPNVYTQFLLSDLIPCKGLRADEIEKMLMAYDASFHTIVMEISPLF